MTTKQYNEAVELLADGLFRFAAKKCNDRSLAKDIVQDAFARLWVKKENVNENKVKSYLFTSVNRLVIDYWRKSKRLTDMEALSQNPIEKQQEYSNLKEILDRELKKLPEIQRTVLLLRDYESFSYEEIGSITDLSEAQVKVYIYRGRKALKKRLEKLNIVA
ncbi:MAG TPA: RNA polymerase sigma factor [Saprospiraceae bacterium]|nr:RNA polymerase sigma factor [Saprospiraceae bacterium]